MNLQELDTKILISLRARRLRRSKDSGDVKSEFDGCAEVEETKGPATSRDGVALRSG